MVKDFTFRYTTILILMLLDIISGLVKVKRAGEKYESAKMATGLYKKISTILCMVVADVLSFISANYLMYTIALVKPVYIYIIIMETLSIVENCDKAELKDLFSKFIEGLKNGKKDE